ncbi:MAG: VOC family protein [Spirochaetales bacterium]|nr:VOC family protein [Spirochaetales bacterium]
MKFCWVTINVRDIDTSIHFYTSVLELEVHRRFTPMPDTEIAFLGDVDSGTEVELIHSTRTAEVAFGKDISLGFEVPSLETMQQKLAQLGIPVHAGPFQPNPSLRFIYILDPNGLRVQLVEHVKA